MKAVKSSTQVEVGVKVGVAVDGMGVLVMVAVVAGTVAGIAADLQQVTSISIRIKSITLKDRINMGTSLCVDSSLIS
jgi:hypothetical protein